MKKILDEAKLLSDRIVAWRRELHRFPELGLETPKTEEFICKTLDDLGVNYRKGVGGHGVVALIEGKPGKCFAWRGDCDGLPIKEDTGLDFASTNGCMHACGHDAHTAINLGAASLLAKHRDELTGTVKILFQPGEETGNGANAMIADGCLENPQVDFVAGLHVGSLTPADWPAGTFGYYPGNFMSFLDSWECTITGRGGHGAFPWLAIDPVLIAARVIEAWQSLVSRESSAFKPMVLTVGKVRTPGAAFNIIPDTCVMNGTSRALSEAERDHIEKRMREIATGIAAASGAKAEFTWTRGASCLVIDPKIAEETAATVCEIFGEGAARKIPLPTLGGEDFAGYLQKIPGVFLMFSTPSSHGQTPHHNPKFEIDDSILWRGSALAAALAMTWLSKN